MLVAKHGAPNGVSNAIGYVQHYSRSREVVIRFYDDADSMIETHEHTRDSTTP